MATLPWSKAVEQITPHIVRIRTPGGSGTGFLISHQEGGAVCSIATACHVVDEAHYWEQPIRIEYNGKTLLLRPADRAIIPDEQHDTAALVFDKKDLGLPTTAFGLAPEGRVMKVGQEIGWLGYPAVASRHLCFFTGRISAHFDDGQYLVDGVAINGVSGGPAFHNAFDKVTLVGVVSAYIPNRATGGMLPGLAVVSSVEPFHEVTKMFKSIEEAKQKEPVPEPPKIESPVVAQEPTHRSS